MPSAKELRDIAKELGLRGYSKMNKGQLTEAIESQVRHNKSEVAKVTESEPENTTPPTPPPAPKQKRASTSPWVQFCREHSKEQGITYKEAMTKKDEYAKWKESRSEVAAE
jgi:hypothetical protein